MPRRKFYLIIVAVVIGVLAAMLWMNRRIVRALAVPVDPAFSPPESVPPEVPPKSGVPEPPAVSRHVDVDTMTPGEARDPASWDLQMEKILGHPRVLKRIEEKGTFRDMRQSPEEYQKKMRWIDARIRETQAAGRSHPQDEEIQRQLQDLYMLKSSLQSLEHVVTSDDRE